MWQGVCVGVNGDHPGGFVLGAAFFQHGREVNNVVIVVTQNGGARLQVLP